MPKKQFGCQNLSQTLKRQSSLRKSAKKWEHPPHSFSQNPWDEYKITCSALQKQVLLGLREGKGTFLLLSASQYLIRVNFFFFVNVAVADEFPLMFVLKGPNPILLCGAFGHLVYQSMKLDLIRFEILHYIYISLITDLSKGHTLLLFSIVFSKQQKHLRNVLRAQKQDKITDN